MSEQELPPQVEVTGEEEKEEGVNTTEDAVKADEELEAKNEDAEEKVAPPAETVNPEEVQKEATETEGAHGETPEESPLAEKPSPSEEAPAVAVEGEEEPPPAAEGEPEAERTAEAPEDEQQEERSHSTVAVEATAEGEALPEGGDAVAKDEEKPPAEEGEGQAEEPATDEPAQEKQGDEQKVSSTPTEGEGRKSPSIVIIGEEGVEETTMALDDAPLLEVESELPQPGTPEKAGSEAAEEEEELLVEEEEPRFSREELMQQYQAAMQEREQLTQQNRTLQHKLSEYFRKKKADDARQEIERSTADQEQRYMKYMSNLEELRQQQTVESENYQSQLAEMKDKKAEKQQKVEEEWNKAIEFKRNVALSAINSRSGRPIPPKDIEMYELHERKKEQEVSQVRLEYIKLKNRLKKQEMQLKQKEELAEGLHLIDFEQLKIENQTYNEKIEERNEELLKLRKKITNTVQVLTHLKEKLQFVQAENAVKKEELALVEQEVAQKRDILSRTKQSRDNLRHENTRFQQRCGLLGNKDLLRDFEMSTDEASDLEHRLDLLKRTHAELTLSLNGIKKKIELAKENQS